MQGAACRALRNTSRRPRSDSPTYIDNSSGPLTETKFTPASVARALASSVLPQPGGPDSSSALGRGQAHATRTGRDSSSGHSTASRNRCLISSSPPTSSQVTLGTSTNTSRMAEGSTSRKASWKSPIVDVQLGQHFVGDIGLGEIDLRQQAAQGDHAGLAAEGLQVGAHEAVRDGRQARQVDVVGQGHAAAVDLQDLLPPVLVGNGDGDFAVEAAGPAQGRDPGRWADWWPPARSRAAAATGRPSGPAVAPRRVFPRRPPRVRAAGRWRRSRRGR